MGDRAGAKQLIAGFHGIENGKWRWTAGKFVVALQPPANAEQKGATLRMHFYLPDGQIEKLGPMTLDADLDGHSLESETYSKGGSYAFSRNVPGPLLRTSLVPIVFTFDKSLPASQADGRELAAVVTDIELESK